MVILKAVIFGNMNSILNPEETAFLVKHIWEMQKVSFPYYFVSDNCAYRLLGLIDLVRPSSNLRKQFTYAAIPIETIKAVEQQGLVREAVYRPALETQLNSQAKQHGHALAKKSSCNCGIRTTTDERGLLLIMMIKIVQKY